MKILIFLAFSILCNGQGILLPILGGAASASSSPPTIFGTPQKALWTSGTTLTVNIPNGGVTIGADTIVIIGTYDRAGTVGFQTPSGYTLVQFADTGSNNSSQFFYKNYSSGATLPASVTLTTLDGSGQSYGGAISIAYQGQNLSATISDSGKSTGAGNFGSITAPNMSTTVANCVLVWLFGSGDTTSPGPSYSQGAEEIRITRNDAGGAFVFTLVDFAFTGTGLTGTNVATFLDTPDQRTAIGVAIAPR